jgi:hypothetical protein
MNRAKSLWFFALFLLTCEAIAFDLRGCPRNADQTQALVYTPAQNDPSTGTCQWTAIPDLTDWLNGLGDALNTTLVMTPDAANQVVSDRGGVSQQLFMSLLQQRYQQRLRGQLREIDLLDACLQGSAPAGSSISANEFAPLASRCPSRHRYQLYDARKTCRRDRSTGIAAHGSV